jgi:hypothetical protein
MKPAQENLHFEDVAETLRSAEFRRAEELSRWLRKFFRSRGLRRFAARRELDRSSALLSAHHRTLWS